MKEYQLFILELYFPPINHHRKRGGEIKKKKSAKAGKCEREESPSQQDESLTLLPWGHCRVLQEHREPRAGAAAPGTAPGSHPSSCRAARVMAVKTDVHSRV